MEQPGKPHECECRVGDDLDDFILILTSQCVDDVDLRIILYNIDVLLSIKCLESFV